MHVITILPGFIDELHVNVEDIEFNISVQSIARLTLKQTCYPLPSIPGFHMYTQVLFDHEYSVYL